MESTIGRSQTSTTLEGISEGPPQEGTDRFYEARHAEAFPRRLEWISIVLFIVNFALMLYSFSIYDEHELWALSMTGVNTATGIILLLSVALSIFGFRKLSQIALGAGLLGMMISVASLGIRLMEYISERNDYWY